MKRVWIALLSGFAALLALAGGYAAARWMGVRPEVSIIAVAAAALAFASTTAVFVMVALDRPSYGTARGAIWLNEEPATQYIFPFRAAETSQIVAKPGMSVGQILMRHDAAFASGKDTPGKSITLTIRGSNKKPFAALTLQQLFLALKPLDLLHVLLVGDNGDFLGYIPGKRAIAEFAGDKSDEKIGKYIIKVLEDPSKSTSLREIGGVSREDTVNETEDTHSAEAKIWANESVQGLIIHRHLKPFGYISKVDVLRLNAGKP